MGRETFYDNKRLGEIPDGRGKVHVTYFYLHNSGLFV